jgi:hypothetical protein
MPSPRHEGSHAPTPVTSARRAPEMRVSDTEFMLPSAAFREVVVNSARSLCKILISIGFLTMANEALGDLVRKQQALDAIDKFADKYCKVVTAEGSSSSSESSSKTDASANGVARFLLSIGFKAASKYVTDNYNWHDRKDVVDISKDNTNCRLTMWAELKQLLNDDEPSSPQKSTVTLTYKS